MRRACIAFWGAFVGLFVLGVGIGFLAVWATGCAAPVVDPPSVVVDDHAVIDATIVAWTHARLPFGPGCHNDLRKLAVVDADPDRVQSCGGEEYSGPVAGCYVPGIAALYVSVEARDRAATVAHEALHWLHDCNGWDIDPAHTGQIPARNGHYGVDVWCPQLWCRLGDALARYRQ